MDIQQNEYFNFKLYFESCVCCRAGMGTQPGPEEKLAVNKANARYFSQARELLGKLDKAQETVGYTRIEKNSKISKSSIGSIQFSQLPDQSSGPKIDTRSSSIPDNF